MKGQLSLLSRTAVPKGTKGQDTGGYTPVSPVPPRMRENDLLIGVLDIAQRLGWRTLHIRPARTATSWATAIQGDGAGFPDILAVRGSRIVAAELKVGRNQLTEAQDGWLAALALAGADCYVWREPDYPDGVLEALR